MEKPCFGKDANLRNFRTPPGHVVSQSATPNLELMNMRSMTPLDGRDSHE